MGGRRERQQNKGGDFFAFIADAVEYLSRHKLNQSSALIQVDIKLEDEGKKRWKASYTPKTQGAHKVFVKFAGQDVPKAPFAVHIEGTPGDPKKCVASGPGIEPKGRPAGKLTHFEVKTAGAGFGQVECVITDPEGKTSAVPMKLTKVADDLYKCEYCPVKPGPHTVQVLFAGKPIPKAPFKVTVGHRKCQ